MNSKVISIFAVVVVCGILSYQNVSTQFASPINGIIARIDSSKLPSDLKAALKALATDIMTQGKNVDGTTLSTHLQNLYDALKANNVKLPATFDKTITDLIAHYKALGSKSVTPIEMITRISPIGLSLFTYLNSFKPATATGK